MSQYAKAIAALLAGIVGLAAQAGLPVEWATPELVQAVTVIITTALVYLIPNKAPQP